MDETNKSAGELMFLIAVAFFSMVGVIRVFQLIFNMFGICVK